MPSDDPGLPLAQWICYSLPGGSAPPRGSALSHLAPELSARVTPLFVRHAQESLPYVAEGSALWQYISLGPQGPTLLTRATRADGQAVVWGLLLPATFVRSGRFVLQPLTAGFPGVQETAWPVAVDLTRLAQARDPIEAAHLLAAAYIEAPALRLPPPQGIAACELLCQVVELLAPADRLQISFATAPLGRRKVEVDPSLPPDSRPPASTGAQAELSLWTRLGGLLDPAIRAGVSLRQNPDAWLPRLLEVPGLPGQVIQLLLLTSTQLREELRAPSLAWLRSALERRLEALAADRSPVIAATLDELCRADLLARADLFPPLWSARVAMKLRVLRALSQPTLAQVLKPEAMPLLLQGLRQGPAGGKTVDLIAALGHLPGDARRRLLDPACEQALTELSGQPQRLRNDGDLAVALAALAVCWPDTVET